MSLLKFYFVKLYLTNFIYDFSFFVENSQNNKTFNSLWYLSIEVRKRDETYMLNIQKLTTRTFRK